MTDDAENDAVAAGRIRKAGHGPGAASHLMPEVNREPGARMALVVFLGAALMLLLRRLFHV